MRRRVAVGVVGALLAFVEPATATATVTPPPTAARLGATVVPTTGCPIPADVLGTLAVPAPPPPPTSVDLPPSIGLPESSTVFAMPIPAGPVAYAMGPSRFVCTPGYASADGANFMSLAPAGASRPALSFIFDAGGVGPNTDLACSYIPDVKAVDQVFRSGLGVDTCPAPPAAEVTTQVATGISDLRAATVVAPAGTQDPNLRTSGSPDAATLAVYIAKLHGPDQATAQEAECTLPPEQRDSCRASLEYFVTQSIASQEGPPAVASITAALDQGLGPPKLDALPQVIPPVSTDADHNGLDDGFEKRLAETWAPVVFMEPGESNYPTNVDWQLHRMRLQHREDGCTPDKATDLPLPSDPPPIHVPPPTPVPNQPNATLTLPSPKTGFVNDQTTLLGRSPDNPWTFPRDVPADQRSTCNGNATSLSTTDGHPDRDKGAVGDEQSWQLYYPGGPSDDTKVGSLDPHQWATYTHIYPAKNGGIVIQYWHVFAYNQLYTDNHDGDWDASLQVLLDDQLHLVGAWFSRHNNDAPGQFYTRSKLSLYHDTHIEEAIDGGGHGAFASPDDWCKHTDTAGINGAGTVHGSIVWPSNTSDPSPGTLHNQNCSAIGDIQGNPSPGTGGTVWQTWTDDGSRRGQVAQGGDVAHRLSANPSSPGPIVLLGQCNPGHQASRLGEGMCTPLNGQWFIKYSGQWGQTRAGGLLRLGFSPRGPVFQGYKDGQYRSWYNFAADAPYTPPRRDAAAPDGPIQRIVFVHGINANCKTVAHGSNDYGDDFTKRLADALHAELDIFCYDHDLGFSTNPNSPTGHDCASTVQWTNTPDHIEAIGEEDHLQTDTDTGGLAVSGPPGEHNLCDGNGPLAFDATRLEDHLWELYQADVQNGGTPKTTLVIGNSMGGAITEGWLQLAHWRHSGTLNMVSTVLFIQGALKGSYVAAAGQGLLSLQGTPLDGLINIAHLGADAANVDPSRPGVIDLAPRSPWYQSLFFTSPSFPRLHLYSVYTDITLVAATHVGPFSAGQRTLDIGDGVMAPGNPDPAVLPAEGGSRSLPYGTGQDQHEFVVHHTLSTEIDPLNPIESAANTGALGAAVFGDPGSHFAFGKHIADSVNNVASCAAGGASTPVPDEMVRILRDPAHGCAP